MYPLAPGSPGETKLATMNRMAAAGMGEAFKEYLLAVQAQGATRDEAWEKARQDPVWFPCVESLTQALDEMFPEPEPEPPKEPEPPPPPKDEEFPWEVPAGGGGSMEDDVRWAYEQLPRVVCVDGMGREWYAWSKATRPPPSMSAVWCLRFAARNQVKFWESAQKLFVLREQETESDREKQEAKSIDALKAILRELVGKRREKPDPYFYDQDARDADALLSAGADRSG